MKRSPTSSLYWQGVSWLAENEPYTTVAQEIGCRKTTMLLADLFGADDDVVATDVVGFMTVLNEGH